MPFIYTATDPCSAAVYLYSNKKCIFFFPKMKKLVPFRNISTTGMFIKCNSSSSKKSRMSHGNNSPQQEGHYIYIYMKIMYWFVLAQSTSFRLTVLVCMSQAEPRAELKAVWHSSVIAGIPNACHLPTSWKYRLAHIHNMTIENNT